MLDVALAPVLTGDNDGQAVFSTQPVTGPAYLVVAALVGMVVFVVGKTDRIENQTVCLLYTSGRVYPKTKIGGFKRF